MEDRDDAHAISDRQSLGEEIANSITHSIGTLLSVAAAVLLITFSSQQRDAWRIVGFSIYGAALIFLYITSTLYHSFSGRSVKRFFRKLDHAAIFLLIAGTYTPVTLILLRESWWGWILLGSIWLMAICGLVLNFIFFGKLRAFSVVFYLVMGWLAVVAFKPITEAAPVGFIIWLITGGIFYSLSVVFYGWRKMPYHHTVFHLLILAGSFSHFFGFLKYLT